MGANFYERNNNGNVFIARGAAVLYEVDAQNLAGVDLWLMMFDSPGLVPPATQPLYSFRVSDGGTISFAIPAAPGLQGRTFPAGVFVTWCATPVYAQDPGPYGESIIFIAGRDLP